MVFSGLKWCKLAMDAQHLIIIPFTLLGLAGLAHGDIDSWPQQATLPASQGIPQGWETYLDRPDILELPPQAHDLEASWKPLKNAHFSFVAELLALYSEDTHFYFLARDAEYLYDVARLVTQGTADFDRVHLLNVSRSNMRDPHIADYLRENGISTETLQSGKKVLLVDTGFSGTIPQVIGELFPGELRPHIKAHLLTSSNPSHPSSRGFLVHLNPSVNESSPSHMHGTIANYEHMPRYMDRSSRFILSEGKFHPISPIGQKGHGVDGTVSKEQSLRYMSDLKAEWQKSETRARFQSEKAQMEMIRNLVIDGTEASQSELKAQLAELIAESEKGRIFEAQIRDLLESQVNLGLHSKVTLEDLGLKTIEVDHSDGYLKKKALIQKYPEWAPILEDPVTNIPKLFSEKNWLMIGNLIDASIDSEINKLLAGALFKAPAQGIEKALQVRMIENGGPSVLTYLAHRAFSKPHAVEMKDLLKLMIEQGDPWALRALAEFTFSRPHAVEMKDLLRLMIEQGESLVLAGLARSTFSQPHAVEMKDLLKLLIEKGDKWVLEVLATFTFSQPHTAEMKDLLKLLIEKGDNVVLQALAEFTFSRPHAVEMKDFLRLMIEQGESLVLAGLARSTFSQPHAVEMKDLLKLLIEKGDKWVLEVLATFTFSQPHTAEMKDLLKLLIEKGDNVVLQALAQLTFSKPHTQTPEHQILKESLAILDPVGRKRFIERELEKMGPPIDTIGKMYLTAQIISVSLRVGDIVIVQERPMKVLRKVGEGRRGVVFQVQAQDNKAFYALKVARNHDLETLKSIEGEISKAHQWQDLGIPHAKVLVQGKGYVLKVWIEGLNGEQIVQNFLDGDPASKAPADELFKLVDKIRSKGAYIGDFRPANLIWSGKAWVIVDSGRIQQGMTFEEAQAKWSGADEKGPKFKRRWRMELPPINCNQLLLKAG